MKTQNAKHKTQSDAAAPALSRRLTFVTHGVLWGILLMLALRLTITETLRETLSQVGARLTGGSGGVPELGAAVTMGFGWVTFLLCGIAAIVGSRAGVISWGRLLKLILVLGILAIGAASMLAAASRFYAMVGFVDLAMALLSGWAISILCHEKVLGNWGRRAVLGIIAALLVSWVARGVYQYFVDIPDTIKWFQKHREDALRDQGLRPEDPETKLFESRMMSREVTGYISLSNVMATGMVGLCAVWAGMLAAGILRKPKPKIQNPTSEDAAHGVPLGTAIAVIGVIVLAAGFAVTILTGSRGGSMLSIVCSVVAAACVWRWEFVSRWRRPILLTVLLGFAAGMIGLAAYGIARDTLPSRSLMFRWHYWTASAEMTRDHPALGVGLNNFGDYYTAYKRPSSPEDVKDPHSFFVRIAAEMGLPAAAMAGVLVVWMLWGTVRKSESEIQNPPSPQPSNKFISLIVAGSAFCIVWWLVRYAIADPHGEAADYYLILDFLSMALAAAGFIMAIMLMRDLTADAVCAVVTAGIVGAVGMMVYDQINMALVTGPVAMMFWVLLGLGDSYESDQRSVAGGRKIAGVTLGVVMFLAGLLVMGLGWLPIVRGDHVWDATPYAVRFNEAATRGDLPAAEAALDEMTARGSRAVDVLRQRIMVREARRESVAADIRRMLELDRANARLWMAMGMMESDLPAAERVKILQRTQELDAQLEETEVKRLTEMEKSELRAMIERLKLAN